MAEEMCTCTKSTTSLSPLSLLALTFVAGKLLGDTLRTTRLLESVTVSAAIDTIWVQHPSSCKEFFRQLTAMLIAQVQSSTVISSAADLSHDGCLLARLPRRQGAKYCAVPKSGPSPTVMQDVGEEVMAVV